jgi:hypothetical protein
MNKDKDLRATAKKFFAAYDAHDVEGMLTLCADGAQGRYLPYGKNSVMPICGGLEKRSGAVFRRPYRISGSK